MTDNMIAKVALAMAQNEGDASGGEFAGAATSRLWIGRAKVAIAAMREPTEEMEECLKLSNMIGIKFHVMLMLKALKREPRFCGFLPIAKSKKVYFEMFHKLHMELGINDL